MAIGKNIKQLRANKNLTQKELAEKLNVTYQAVSRWEKDEVEPSIDTLTQMTQVFECTLDEIFGTKPIEKPEPQVIEKVIIKETEPKVVEKVVVQEAKPVLGVCEECNKAIQESNDLNRVEITEKVKNGRAWRTELKTKILCTDCNNKRIEEETEQKEIAEKERKDNFINTRKKSFIISSIVSAILVIISIVMFVNGDVSSGLIWFGLALLAFTFISCLILDNTFLTEMWIDIASWGFVKFPGVIFSFSLDGLIFLIAIKLLFWFIGILIGAICVGFATVLGLVLSLFVYPFALKKNLEFKDEE